MEGDSEEEGNDYGNLRAMLEEDHYGPEVEVISVGGEPVNVSRAEEDGGDDPEDPDYSPDQDVGEADDVVRSAGGRTKKTAGRCAGDKRPVGRRGGKAAREGRNVKRGGERVSRRKYWNKEKEILLPTVDHLLSFFAALEENSSFVKEELGKKKKMHNIFLPFWVSKQYFLLHCSLQPKSAFFTTTFAVPPLEIDCVPSDQVLAA